MLSKEVTKENLNTLVVKFYSKVIRDDLIGPIFISVLGKDLKSDIWKAHITLLTDFWASLTNEPRSLPRTFAVTTTRLLLFSRLI